MMIGLGGWLFCSASTIVRPLCGLGQNSRVGCLEGWSTDPQYLGTLNLKTRVGVFLVRL